MDVEGIRRRFPFLNQSTYLGTAAHGPLPIDATDAMQRSLHNEDVDERSAVATSVRRLAADIMRVSEEEIVLMSNVSAGINLLAGSLAWKQGDNIVVCEREYPANVIPWKYQAERRGLDLRIARPLDLRATEESILHAIDDRTRVVAISLVEFGTGYTNQVRALAEQIHRRGGLLCVDGVQAVGAIPVDAPELGIDVLACGGYKWLCGPPGTGFTYVRQDLMRNLAPPVATYENTSKKWEKSIDQFMSYGTGYPSVPLELADNARKFGFPIESPVLYAGLAASMRLLTELGLDWIYQRVASLAEHFLRLLADRRLRLLHSFGQPHRAGIVSLRIPDHLDVNQVDLEGALRERGIIAHLRVGGIRCSIHFFNTEEELERAVDVLADFLSV